MSSKNSSPERDTSVSGAQPLVADIKHSVPMVKYTVQDLTWDGRGVVRTLEGRVIFLPGALPGDEVSIDPDSLRSQRSVENVQAEIVIPSPQRWEHPCPHYTQRCLNSPLGAWNYRFALDWKHRHLRQTLIRLGGIENPPIADIVPAPDEWGYRNRLEFQLCKDNGAWGLNYRASRGFISLQNCLLGNRSIQASIARVINNFKESSHRTNNCSMVSPRKNLKNVPRLLLRDNGRGGCLAVLFIEKLSPEELNQFRSFLIESALSGWQIRKTPSMASRFLNSIIIDEGGETFLEVAIASGHTLKADLLVFTQVNTAAAAIMTAKLLEHLPEAGSVLDLYGGYGAFALQYCLTKNGSAAVIDASRAAVQAGRAFARQSGLPVDYYVQDLNHDLSIKTLNEFSAILLDPPHSGCSSALLERLNAAGSPVLIYVSCHPAALARDLKRLDSYHVELVIPFDLFPQTPALESLAVLQRK